MAYTFKHGDRPIDGITVQRAVGRGGFGEVYYALTDSGKQVAVKYLRDNPEVELRGIAHVMNLKSPYLITIYDVRHSEAGDPYVIMEYVSGPSLRELLIAEPNGLGPQKAAFFVKGIANGLSYLHERGIVHRDLKPGNIFYDDGYVKIGDYGLSKHIAISAHSGNTISVGTVHYMAPEIGSGSYTKSIDIYALGVMLYEMLTGRLPFTGSSMGEVLMRHLSDQPDISGIPEPFAGVIAKALAKDPKDRYQDVDEMVEALTSISEVSESLASFDASVLAQTPRTAEPAKADRTRTTPPKAPPVPVLDARAEVGDLPRIPPIPAVLSGRAARKARKLQEKARKLQQKMEKKGRVVHAKLANLGLAADIRHAAVPGARSGRSRWRAVMIALIVLFAVSGGLGVGHEDGVVFGASLLYLLGGTVGTLLAYALSVRRNAAEHDFQDRLLFGACGFVFMMPAFAAGHEVGRYDNQFAWLIIPLTATLVLFNWTDRIQMGRRQVVCGWTVFWHGVVAAIIAPMVGAQDYALASAILAGGLLIVVQSVAGLWPLATGPMPRPPGARGRGHGWRRFEGAYQRVASAIEGVGERFEKSVDRGKAGSPDADKPTDTAERKAEASDTKEQPQQPMIIEGYQPSFVGRTANAGLSFMAKLLLLAGLTVAVLFSAKFTIPADGVYITYGQDAGRIVIAEGGYKEVDEQIPRGAVAAPLLLGSVLLIVARRHDGTAHFVRGFFGCALACLVAILVLGPAADEMELFLSGDWCSLETGDRFVALIWLGALVTGALLLLFWPKPTQRGDKPIVI